MAPTPPSAGPAREGKTRRAIVKLLKTEGALDPPDSPGTCV
jgi:hypothetical protein